MTVDQYVALLARLIEDNEPALIAAREEMYVQLLPFYFLCIYM